MNNMGFLFSSFAAPRNPCVPEPHCEHLAMRLYRTFTLDSVRKIFYVCHSWITRNGFSQPILHLNMQHIGGCACAMLSSRENRFFLAQCARFTWISFRPLCGNALDRVLITDFSRTQHTHTRWTTMKRSRTAYARAIASDLGWWFHAIASIMARTRRVSVSVQTMFGIC